MGQCLLQLKIIALQMAPASAREKKMLKKGTVEFLSGPQDPFAGPTWTFMTQPYIMKIDYLSNSVKILLNLDNGNMVKSSP